MRRNPLMRGYFREIGPPGRRLARRRGVSHSQIYMARERNVGPGNAEKISRGVANILGLSEEDRLLLKAEIMGYPGDLPRAWLGNVSDAVRLPDAPEPTASEILDPGRTITHRSGERALRALRDMNAPEAVIESVDRRLMPPPKPRRGLITHDPHGPELAERGNKTRESLSEIKPATASAIRASGLRRKDIYERAGVGKETLRRALYGRAGNRAARDVAGALAEAARLFRDEAGPWRRS